MAQVPRPGVPQPGVPHGHLPHPGVPRAMPHHLPPAAMPVAAQPAPVAPGVLPAAVPTQQPVNKWASLPPNHTLYINNLNEKLKREDLTKGLQMVFGQFGEILQVTCYTKILKAKGQAFVTFSDIQASTKALREMQGFMFYNKPMRVSYAKTKSDTISKRDGTYKPRRKKRKFVKDDKSGKFAMKLKMQKTESAPRPAYMRPAQQAAPNETLYIQNLPPDCSDSMVKMLFDQYPGFEAVRLIDGKPGIGFVDFTSEFEAGRAMQALQGIKITPTNPLHITYAKK